MIYKPRGDTFVVETAETLKASHGHADFEFLQADGALGLVDAIFFRGFVRVHAAAPRCDWRGGSYLRIDVPRATVPAVRLNTLRDMGFPQTLEIWQRTRG